MRGNISTKILLTFVLFSIAIAPTLAGVVDAEALLVIDIQSEYVALYEKQAFDNFLINVNRVIDKASFRDVPVIYIRQRGGGDIYDKVHRKSTIEFEKNTESAFSIDELNGYLKDRNITELYIVGLDAAYCVSTTAHVSVNRGYKTTVITDAVITYTDWQEVLADYADIDLPLTSSEEY